MRKFQITSVIYVALIILCLTSCSSCSKKQNKTLVDDYSYEDFKDAEDCNNNTEDVDPLFEKEYHMKIRVVRRVYLV